MEALFLSLLFAVSTVHLHENGTALTVETDYVRWDIGTKGETRSLLDKSTEEELMSAENQKAFSSVLFEGKEWKATEISPSEKGYRILYGASGVEAEFRIQSYPHYFSLSVHSLNNPSVEALTLLDLSLNLPAGEEEKTTACVLAANLRTHVPDLPGPASRLRASAVKAFGIVGAQVNIILCPGAMLRPIMKEAVENSPELPRHKNQSVPPVGGPWALDASANKGSYLFDFGTLTEDTVDEWIDLVQQLGFRQIDFHTGTSLRFGDLTPNEKLFPEGRKSVKSVIDRLHGAGIAAGLHTYAFFIAKNSPYVTPVPDPRLGKDEQFTLDKDLGETGDALFVAESTEKVKTDTGFFARNSVTLQVENELIVFSGVTREPPFSFTGCVRGAHGTRASSHAAGTPVYKLKECFGLFLPDGNSTLLTEIAAVTADTFNECGFDMIYLDALDGSDIFEGPENSWYYAPKFAFEIAQRLERPALFEMSTMSHHLWFIRARMGAWDHPARSHKRFIDLHCEVNRQNSTMFLPMNLGWWAVKNWQPGAASAWSEPTWPDDIEYLLCKALANGASLSLMGVNPDNLDTMPAFERLLPLFKTYETARLSGMVAEEIKEQLRAPGAEFTLKTTDNESFSFYPAATYKHTADFSDPFSLDWAVENPFDEQPVRFRIETLLSPASFDSQEAQVLLDYTRPEALNVQKNNDGVSAEIAITESPLNENEHVAAFTLLSTRENARGSWAQIGAAFSPPVNAGAKAGLGCFVYGDGSGALLNLQTLSAAHTAAGGIGDHYIPLDFTGWRYISVVEFESGAIPQWHWPYGDQYSIYREHVDFGALESFSFWFNNLPKDKTVHCKIGPVKALPLLEGSLKEAALIINGSTLSLPVTISSGCCLEYDPQKGAFLYNEKGEVLAQFSPSETILLKKGTNSIRLTAANGAALPAARARITILTEGTVPLH